MSKLNLSETLKRYNLLTEYNFYIPRKEDSDNMYKGVETNLEEQDVAAPEAAGTPTDVATTDTTTPVATEPTTTDTATTTTTPPMDPNAVAAPTTTSTGEVEVDVTDIVNDTKATKDAVNTGNQKVDELLTKLSDLETKLSSMGELMIKIEELEDEIQKRNPTPEEKLEMRSLDSFPYNLKLTDYWSDKEGAYNVIKNSKKIVPTEEKEYVLTQGEVEKDYNEGEISDSFYPENE